jgi:hypothetical protein
MVKINLSAHEFFDELMPRNMPRPETQSQSKKTEQPPITAPPVDETVPRPQSPSQSEKTEQAEITSITPPPQAQKSFDFSKLKRKPK